MNQPNEQLLKNFIGGDREAFNELVREYLQPVYGFVYRFTGSAHDAEDVVQETFMKVWKNAKRYDPKKSFTTWIFSIAKNASIDFLRKQKTIPFSSFEDDEGINSLEENLRDPFPLPDELASRADAAKILSDAIDKLDAKYRVVLHLYYDNHLNFREISEILEEPIDTIKSRHRRALIMLKKSIDAPKR